MQSQLGVGLTELSPYREAVGESVPNIFETGTGLPPVSAGIHEPEVGYGKDLNSHNRHYSSHSTATAILRGILTFSKSC